jgi:hypothetical protein
VWYRFAPVAKLHNLLRVLMRCVVAETGRKFVWAIWIHHPKLFGLGITLMGRVVLMKPQKHTLASDQIDWYLWGVEREVSAVTRSVVVLMGMRGKLGTTFIDFGFTLIVDEFCLTSTVIFRHFSRSFGCTFVSATARQDKSLHSECQRGEQRTRHVRH